MGTILKKSFVIFFITIIISRSACIPIYAEDQLLPGGPMLIDYPFFESLTGGQVDGDRTDTYLTVLFPESGVITGCCWEHYPGPPVPSTWYWTNMYCFTLPLSPGDGWALYQNDNELIAEPRFYHGYENMRSNGDGTYRGYFCVTTSRAGSGPYLLRVVVVWSPEGGIQQIGEITSNTTFTYRKKTAPDVTHHYSPLVQSTSPVPAFAIDQDNTGYISGYSGTTYVTLNGQVNTDVPYEIRAGYSGKVLTFTPGTSTTVTNRYTATRNTSGASNIISGSTYSGIGMGTVAWSVTDWQQDTTNFTQQIIVTTTGAPDIMIYLAGTNTIYNNQWMSQHTSADAERQAGLDVQASSSINGNYDLVSYINGTERQSNAVTKTGSTAVTNTRVNWQNANTSAAGIPVTSRAFLVGNRATALSNMSGAKYMRWDNDQPTISSITPNADWTAITGHNAVDALSGLETTSGGVFYKIVKKTDPVIAVQSAFGVIDEMVGWS